MGRGHGNNSDVAMCGARVTAVVILGLNPWKRGLCVKTNRWVNGLAPLLWLTIMGAVWIVALVWHPITAWYVGEGVVIGLGVAAILVIMWEYCHE